MKKDWLGFSDKDIELFRKIKKPSKIQDFLNKLKINFEENGESCMSPKQVLKTGKAHCIEGAMLAAAILKFHGHQPLVMDFETIKEDEDHVVALFNKHGCWGCLSKTNHSILRYREPIYKNIRELAMSFFHEYFLFSNGKKTLRAYSNPIDLSRFDSKNWMNSKEDVWFVADYLENVKHTKILNKKQIHSLRKADLIEIKSGKLVEFIDPRKTKRN